MNARSTTRGLHIGTPIRVVGAPRRFARGEVSQEPKDGAIYLTYRAYYNGGERLAPVDKVRRVKKAARPKR